MNAPAPLLFPSPRRIELLGGTCDRLSVERRRLDSSSARYRDQAFVLDVRDSVTLHADGVAGTRYAEGALRQLIAQYGAQLPRVRVEDEPAFATRGVMLDVSRDRVPRMDDLFRVIPTLASMRINHLQLYTEHTFAYAGHEDVWSGCSPFTPDEILRLDSVCADHGIDLCANQNCFGHLARWLALPRYAPLAETTGEWRFMEWTRRGGFSLCPEDPGSITLVRELLRQLLPCFRAELVNINCDETLDIGQGRSAGDTARRGRGVVWAEFVAKVAAAAHDLGKRPMFWADIALSEPAALSLLPEDMIALAWGYEPDARFDAWCTTLASAGFARWVCPGTSSWRSIIGRTEERRANLDAAVRGGLIGGATGLLITDWGDSGHHQQWPLSLHGIARAADAAWRGHVDDDSLSAESVHVFGDTSRHVAAWLDELGDADAAMRRTGGRPDAEGRSTRMRNAGALFTDMMTPWNEPHGAFTATDFESVQCGLERLEAMLPAELPGLLDDEIRHTLRYALTAARRGRMRRSASDPLGRARLHRDVRDLISEHRRLWLIRSRPGGLEHSCGFFDPALEGRT